MDLGWKKVLGPEMKEEGSQALPEFEREENWMEIHRCHRAACRRFERRKGKGKGVASKTLVELTRGETLRTRKNPQ